MLTRVRSSRLLVVLLLSFGFGGLVGAAQPAPEVDASRVDLVLVRHLQRGNLEQSDLPVIWKSASFFVALWNEEQQGDAARAAIPFEILARDFGPDRPLQLVETHLDMAPPRDREDRVLWHEGRKWLLEMSDREVERLDHAVFFHKSLSREPRRWPPRAPAVAYDCSYDPLIDEMLQATTQARWLDWIEKLSGDESILVDGTAYSVETRYTSLMFSGSPIAKAYDYTLQQVQAMDYAEPERLDEHLYSEDGETWKNLVLTIPGQTSPEQLVLMTGHLDTINLANPSNAPGANDNGSGVATMLEVARLMRRYRFERTVKIIFFTGEETGRDGSRAWVQDHPTNNILGVVNLDMFGWDSDGDRCFEIHAGTIPASVEVANCYDASIGSYNLGLSRDFLTTGATDRSDHASFWQVGVGAIEIAENFFNDGLAGGCDGQDANPGYHTVNDRIQGNMHPSFGYDVARAGMATIAAMAKPIGKCFDSAPFLSAVPDVNAVHLSWTPVTFAARYRIYRSLQGCGGQWFAVGETMDTAWTDTDVEPAIHSYRVEATNADGSCVSVESNCAAATPTVYNARSVGLSVQDSCASGGPGDGDGVLDPGETAIVPVILENAGNVVLTQVGGRLSVLSGDAVVTDPVAAWPDIAVGQSAQSLPDHFGLQVSTAAVCGSSLDATIDVSYAGGSNATGLDLVVGDPVEILLVNEGFSQGIPLGWEVIDGGSGGGAAATWTTNNPGGREIDPPFEGPFAIVDSDAAGSGATQDEILITTSFDATGCQELYLEFSNQFNYYGSGGNETADVDVSVDGGQNWTNLLRITGADDGHPAPVTKVVDLGSLLAGDVSGLKLRFHYYDGTYEWWWAVDNIEVRCEYLDCSRCGAGANPPGEAATSAPLRIDRAGENLMFEWGAPDAECTVADYAVYRGNLATLRAFGYTHNQALSCATGDSSLIVSETHPALSDADYFLVVSDNGSREGSYGRNSGGAERPVSTSACHATQDLSDCGP